MCARTESHPDAPGALAGVPVTVFGTTKIETTCHDPAGAMGATPTRLCCFPGVKKRLMVYVFQPS